VQGGFFLRKKPLGRCGFGVQQLENSYSSLHLTEHDLQIFRLDYPTCRTTGILFLFSFLTLKLLYTGHNRSLTYNTSKKEEFPGIMRNMLPGNSFPQICVVSVNDSLEVVESAQDYGSSVD
jgi:hypothetical protein